jgi:hypothetical protein
MSNAFKCSSVSFWKIYLELLSYVVFKIFAFLGLYDHVYSFVAIVHFDCLLASHEWRDASQVHNSQDSKIKLLSWIISLKILIFGISSNQVRMKLLWNDSIFVLMTKVESWRKSLLRKIFSYLLKSIYLETCPIFKKDILMFKGDWNGRTSFFCQTKTMSNWNGHQFGNF